MANRTVGEREWKALRRFALKEQKAISPPIGWRTAMQWVLDEMTRLKRKAGGR